MILWFCRGWVLRVFMKYWQCCSLQRLSGGICPCWQRSGSGELRGDYQEDQGNHEWQDGAQGVKEGNSCHRFFGAMSLRGEKYPFLSHPKRFFASTKWICPFNYSTMSAPSSSLHVRMGVMDQSLWHCALQMTRICHKYGPFKRTLSLQEMFTAGSRVLHSATTFTGAPVHFSQVRHLQ